MANSRHLVALVGLGAAGTFAARALQRIDGTEIVAGVDTVDSPALEHGWIFPVMSSVDELATLDGIDIAIVSVPTHLHHRVCGELLEHGVAPEIWCEKPLTSTADDATALLTAAADVGAILRVLLHTTFAPEVLWAQQQIDDLIDRHGPVVTVASVFHDAYQDDLDRRTASLASSWLDSGINAVSVLWRLFVLGDLLDASGRDPLSGKARVNVSRSGHDSVASISTSWETSDGQKSTAIEFGDEWSLVLDHSNATASILDARSNTAAVHEFGRAALDARYRTMFDAYLKRSQSMPGAEDVVAMHRLLFDVQGIVEAGRDAG